MLMDLVGLRWYVIIVMFAAAPVVRSSAIMCTCAAKLRAYLIASLQHIIAELIFSMCCALRCNLSCTPRGQLEGATHRLAWRACCRSGGLVLLGGPAEHLLGCSR
jgi:hypothetical protein